MSNYSGENKTLQECQPCRDLESVGKCSVNNSESVEPKCWYHSFFSPKVEANNNSMYFQVNDAYTNMVSLSAVGYHGLVRNPAKLFGFRSN